MSIGDETVYGNRRGSHNRPQVYIGLYNSTWLKSKDFMHKMHRETMQSYVYAVAVDANGSTTECVLYALYCNVKHQ